MNLIALRMWLKAWMGDEAEQITVGMTDPHDFLPVPVEPASLAGSLPGSASPSPNEMALECDRWSTLARDPRTASLFRRAARGFRKLDPSMRVVRPASQWELLLDPATGTFDVDQTFSPLLPSLTLSVASVDAWCADLEENRDHVPTYRLRPDDAPLPLYAVEHLFISQYFLDWIHALMGAEGVPLSLQARQSDHGPVFYPNGMDDHLLDIAMVLYCLTGRRPRIVLREREGGAGKRPVRHEAWMSLE